MAIAAGTVLGRYEIRTLLGIGGMGEVYLAQDTQLRRSVAIKLLPSSFTQDEDRLRRFEQEAYAASALNHPNILTIYEIGHVDSVRFIAMEYVDGLTLRQYLSPAHHESGQTTATGGGIKLGEAIDLAIQIASALSASQAAGIAHRDIKPENIMVRRDGYVKVLDFGLAKLTEQPDGTDTEAPTRALVNTSPGAVMGTANYMSPEQARGRTVDARTDIWSLGVVIYEMLAGRLPFEGPTPSHVIVSILEKDPPPLARYLTDVPETLEWIITKALTKDPEDRYQTAREMLTDLRRLKQRLDVGAELERSVAPNTTSGLPSDFPTRMQSNVRTISAFPGDEKTSPIGGSNTLSSAEYLVGEVKRHKFGFALALLGVFAIVAGGWFAWNRFSRATPARPFQNMKLTRLTDTGKATIATISPDGNYVVHVVNEGGQSSLWVRQVATSSNVQIVPPAQSNYIGQTFSPDGVYVYYTVYERTSPVGIVYQIPALGGQPRKILEDSDTPIAFSPDGKRFAFVRQFPQSSETAVFIARADGTGEEKIASRNFPLSFNANTNTGLSWSPDGTMIAATVSELVSGVINSGVAVVDLKSRATKPLGSAQWTFAGQAKWTPTGNGLIVTAQEQFNSPVQLWYVSYPSGATSRITNDLNTYNGVGLSADGSKLATVESQSTFNVWLAPAGDASQATRLTSGKNEGSTKLAWTSDGRIVYAAFTGASGDIWTIKSDGTDAKQVIAGGRLNGFPTVSNDDKYVVFVSVRTGSPHLYRMNLDGSDLKQLTNGGGELAPAVTPDGRWVVFNNIPDNRIWKVSIDGGDPVRISDKLAGQPAISPDGKLIACRYREAVLQPFQLGIISLETGQTVKAIDLPATSLTGAGLQWATDGRSVMYSDTRNGISNIWSQPIDGSPAKQLTNFKADQIFCFSWSRDGKVLAMARGNVSNDVVLISETK